MYNTYLCHITEIYDIHRSTSNVTLGHVLEQVHSCCKYENILKICNDTQTKHIFMS